MFTQYLEGIIYQTLRPQIYFNLAIMRLIHLGRKRNNTITNYLNLI